MRIQHTDREQVDMLKGWWKESGQAIAIAVVVGLALGFGWKFYKSWQLKQKVAASSLYQQFSNGMLQDPTAATAIATQLKTSYPKTAYATLASMMLAKQAVDSDQYKDASTELNWVIQHSHDKQLKQISRIRLARVMLQLKQPNQALSVLATQDAKGYAMLVNQERANSYLALGNKNKARYYFARAKSNANTLNLPNPVLQMQLAQYPQVKLTNQTQPQQKTKRT